MLILVVDDNLYARAKLKKILISIAEGCEIIDCSGGAEALLAVKSHTFDRAFLDYNMEDMNGLAVAQAIKKVSPELPIAICSANSQKKLKDRFEEFGLAFIPKPPQKDAVVGFLDSIDATDD